MKSYYATTRPCMANRSSQIILSASENLIEPGLEQLVHTRDHRMVVCPWQAVQRVMRGKPLSPALLLRTPLS